ncbi:MAG: hypothetical protein ABIJ09_17555 [Pseudomonadota bacterium]
MADEHKAAALEKAYKYYDSARWHREAASAATTINQYQKHLALAHSQFLDAIGFGANTDESDFLALCALELLLVENMENDPLPDLPWEQELGTTHSILRDFLVLEVAQVKNERSRRRRGGGRKR